MKTKLTYLLLLALLALSLPAQVKISGTIVDASNKEKVEYASIALLKKDSTFVAGASSDTLGTFVFSNIPHGDYILSATYVGYEKQYMPINSVNKDTHVGHVALKASDIALNTVTVTAQAVIQKIDRKLIMPSEAQIKASNNGVTLLRNLQLSRLVINPIDNSISIPGADAVQLRVNGVEVNIQEIMALQPADVIRIEYHEEPSMRYGKVGAVIDYIVRRKETGGSVSANLGNMFFQGIDWGENNLAAKVNHKKSEFSVNGYWSRRGIEWIRENEERFVYPDKVIENKEVGDPSKFKDQRLNLSFNYNLNEPDKYVFNARLRNNYQHTPNGFEDRNSSIYSNESSAPAKVSDHSTWRNNTPSLDLYYQRKLKNEQVLIFNVVGTYMDSRSSREYIKKNGDIFRSYSEIFGDKYSLIGEGIYEKSFKSGKLSTGLKHSQSYTRNLYAGDFPTNINMHAAETYLYAEYMMKVKKFNYTFGLGATRTYNSQGGKGNEKYVFRPNLRVSYNINDNAYIRYNGFISSYAPSLSNLNNVMQVIDKYQVRQGNPNLETVWYYTQTLNAGYNKGIFGAELFIRYSYDHKPMMEEVSFGKVEIDQQLKDMFIRSTANQKGFHRLFTNLTLKLKPWKEYINISLSPGFNRYISNGNNFTHTYSLWRIRGSVYGMYKGFTLGFEANSRWNNFWAETEEQGEKMHTIFAGYNRPKWSVTVAAFNPFWKKYDMGSQNLSKLTPSRSYVYSNDFAGTIMVNFTMNLNFGRKFNAGNKRLNNDDSDTGIMSGGKK